MLAGECSILELPWISVKRPTIRATEAQSGGGLNSRLYLPIGIGEDTELSTTKQRASTTEGWIDLTKGSISPTPFEADSVDSVDSVV